MKKRQFFLLSYLLMLLGVSLPLNAQFSFTVNENRRYDEISWLINHNAYNNRSDGSGLICFGGGNQDRSIADQLRDGVRNFMVDIYRVNGELRLKHGPTNTCMMDAQKFNNILYSWIKNHPQDIITLHIESGPNLGLSGLDDIFKGRRSGYKNLSSYIYNHKNFASVNRPRGAGSDVYPTVREMLNQNKQLVIFTERNYGHDMYRYEFSSTMQNPYRAGQVNELFNADKFHVDRGVKHKTIMTINHFAGDAPTYNGDKNKSRDANRSVLEKGRLAWWMFGHRPSIAVDYYNLSNGRLAMRQIEDINNWNEVRGVFRENGRGVNDVIIHTAIFRNGQWRDRTRVEHKGKGAKWHLFYSVPAPAGEKRAVWFSHPNYTFSPGYIELDQYEGNEGRTFNVNIQAIRK